MVSVTEILETLRHQHQLFVNRKFLCSMSSGQDCLLWRGVLLLSFGCDVVFLSSVSDKFLVGRRKIYLFGRVLPYLAFTTCTFSILEKEIRFGWVLIFVLNGLVVWSHFSWAEVRAELWVHQLESSSNSAPSKFWKKNCSCILGLIPLFQIWTFTLWSL